MAKGLYHFVREAVDTRDTVDTGDTHDTPRINYVLHPSLVGAFVWYKQTTR